MSIQMQWRVHVYVPFSKRGAELNFNSVNEMSEFYTMLKNTRFKNGMLIDYVNLDSSHQYRTLEPSEALAEVQHLLNPSFKKD